MNDRRYKVYLPHDVWLRHLSGRTDCGEWVPYLNGRKAVCVTTPEVAARVYELLRHSGDEEAARAADQSEEQLNWHLQD
jgi:hypothetical protein